MNTKPFAELTAAEVSEIVLDSEYEYEKKVHARDAVTGHLIRNTDENSVDYYRVESITTETEAIQDWSNLKDLIKGRKLEDPLVISLGTVHFIESFGGEGEGDDFWFVFSISDGKITRLFKMPGWYASHCGGEYDGDLYEVKPVDKIVTFYE